jgi:hypothetical protein
MVIDVAPAIESPAAIRKRGWLTIYSHQELTELPLRNKAGLCRYGNALQLKSPEGQNRHLPCPPRPGRDHRKTAEEEGGSEALPFNEGLNEGLPCARHKYILCSANRSC